MSIFKIAPDQIETFTIVTNPHREFMSSSAGATGSVYVQARRSPAEKDISETGFLDSPFGDSSLEAIRSAIRNRLTSSSNISYEMGLYMSAVNSRKTARRNSVSLPVNRYTPTTMFSENTLRKNAVRSLLFPYYRVDYPTANWGYTNYHSLNFYTAPTVPTASVLLYPNDVSVSPDGLIDGTYVLTGGFTFDFYVNPRFRTKSDTDEFHASTLLHLSSCYAISLVTGSEKDYNGRSKGYRILLQLSHSADIKPSEASPSAYPYDLVFLSDDNSLQYNHWHHVVIRWGTSSHNNGTGSILIDGKTRGIFCVPSSTLAPRQFAGGQAGPNVLCVGNFYEGTNNGSSAQAHFFSKNVAERLGLRSLIDDTTEEPASYAFTHPFNAEFHDVVIKDGFDTDDIVHSGSGLGLTSLDGVKFFLPPFFTPESPWRKRVGDSGGVLQTPFVSIDGTTDDPFNVAMAFGVGGHYINLENFVRDFATGRYPRLHLLSASEIAGTAEYRTCNDILYDMPAVVRRNTTVLPCDDGNFVPNFDFLSSGSRTKFADDLGSFDPSWISLNDLIPTATLHKYVIGQSGSLFERVVGATPESPGVKPGEALAIFQRTRDNSSDQVTFFNISNLYYGLRIRPESFVISDSAFTSSAGSLSFSLRDDGFGNLYRADAFTPHAKWNSVGNVLYNEGIVVVKSPHLYFFGKEGFSVSLDGEQTIHTLRFNVMAPAGYLNSSSNPSYLPLSASHDANDLDRKFVYLSDVYYMDDNYNVVMKSTLAQPIMKRTGDKIMIRTKIDF